MDQDADTTTWAVISVCYKNNSLVLSIASLKIIRDSGCIYVINTHKNKQSHKNHSRLHIYFIYTFKIEIEKSDSLS